MEVENMEQIINIIVFTILAVISLRVIWNGYKDFKLTRQIEGFTEYLSILEYHMSKAYDLIHKDRILIYSLEGMRIEDKDFNSISQDFVRLVLKFIGPSLKKIFVDFYGNEDTFIFNMIEYFNTRYEEDSIRKETMDEMSSDNDKSTIEVPNYEQPKT
jgi:hypothetical protein